MAHSAVVIDQFVVVFGGLNKITNGLISNDLYVLCLNGNANALLPKEKILDEKKRPGPKGLKQSASVTKSPTTSESFVIAPPATFESAIQAHTESVQSAKSNEESSANNQKQQMA